MSNIRLFYPESLSINLEAQLDKPKSHYLIKVMRIKEGDSFSLFNKSGEWKTTVTKISRSNVEFKILKKIRITENENEIWLAFSPIKSNYFNFMIQKATELGVTKFLPVLTKRTIVRKINFERLSKIIVESCEQSNRISIPEITKPVSLDKFFEINSSINLVFGDINTENKLIKFENNKPICLLIGPEGDFSEDEKEKIIKFAGVQSLKLSKNILRTETAVISALSVINYLIN